MIILILYLHTTLPYDLSYNCFFTSSFIAILQIKHKHKSNEDSNAEAHNPENSKKYSFLNVSALQ